MELPRATPSTSASRRSTPARCSSKRLAGVDRSGAEAPHHRRHLHRGLRGGGASSCATCSSSPRARSIPDVIESVSFKGPSATIKSHHNVGGLPERMRLKLVEPLRELFKDEVRAARRWCSASRRRSSAATRFPGPGPRHPHHRRGDRRARRRRAGRRRHHRGGDPRRRLVRQASGRPSRVLLPVRTVGVMGDERTYENVLAIRAVESRRRHDRRLGAPAAASCWRACRAASSTR